MGTFRVRHYLGASADEAGRHRGRWRELRFASLEEAKAHQETHGGTLYLPRDHPSRVKPKRKRRARRADQAVAGDQLRGDQAVAGPDDGLVSDGSHI